MHQIPLILLALLPGALPALAGGPPQQAAAVPRLLIYPGDLTLVEEIEPVLLPAGRATVRLDFVRGNADVNSLEVVPLDRPGEVAVVALLRRDELGNATFVELEAKSAGPERLRLRYAAHGLTTAVSYLVAWNAPARTLDLVQELEVANSSGESFAQAQVSTVFGDVHTVPSSAVVQGRAPDPDMNAQPGLPPPLLKQDFQEHTIVSFGAPLALPDGVTVRRRTLDMKDVAASIEHRFDAGAYGGRVWRVAKAANLANVAGQERPQGLGGVTLQPGSLFLVEREATGTERFLHGGAIGHTPPGRELELDLGPTDELKVERKQADLVRSDLVFGDYNRALVSYSEEESLSLEIRNHVAEPRTLIVTEHVSTGTFEVLESSVPATRKDATTLEFRVDLPATATVTLTYKVKKTDLRP